LYVRVIPRGLLWKLCLQFFISVHDVRGRWWWYGSSSRVFPKIFHYILLLCDRWQQRGNLTKWLWHGSTYEAKVCHWILPCRKKCIQWQSLMVAECLWRPNSGCEHSEVMGSTFQQWWQWVTSLVQVFMCGIQALVHHWQKCIAKNEALLSKRPI